MTVRYSCHCIIYIVTVVFFFIIQGQCFIAIDPSSFADGFTDRMTELIDQCRGVESVSSKCQPMSHEREIHKTVENELHVKLSVLHETQTTFTPSTSHKAQNILEFYQTHLTVLSNILSFVSYQIQLTALLCTYRWIPILQCSSPGTQRDKILRNARNWVEFRIHRKPLLTR
jgi:hypothetical protein